MDGWNGRMEGMEGRKEWKEWKEGMDVHRRGLEIVGTSNIKLEKQRATKTKFPERTLVKGEGGGGSIKMV